MNEKKSRQKTAFVLALISLGIWIICTSLLFATSANNHPGALLGLLVLGSGVLGIIGVIKAIQGFSIAKNWKFWFALIINSLNSLFLISALILNVVDILTIL